MPNGASVPARELSSINFRSMLGGPLIAVVEAQAQSAMTTVEFIKTVGFMPSTPDPEQSEPADTGEPIYVSFKYPKEVAPYQPEIPAHITNIDIDSANPPIGYTQGQVPSVDISQPQGPGGTQASATAVVDNNGTVTSITLVDAGSGYTQQPTATLNPAAPNGSSTLTVNWVDTRAAVPAQFQEMKLEVPILTMLPIPFIRVEETTIDFNAKINSMEESETSSLFKLDGELKYSYRTEGEAQVPIKLIKLGGKLSQSVDMKVSTSYQKQTQSGYKVDRTYSMNVHIRAVQDEMPAGTERILGILEDNIKAQPTNIPAPRVV